MSFYYNNPNYNIFLNSLWILASMSFDIKKFMNKNTEKTNRK